MNHSDAPQINSRFRHESLQLSHFAAALAVNVQQGVETPIKRSAAPAIRRCRSLIKSTTRS